MAKDKSESSASPAARAAAAASFKFGVSALAKELNIKEASARVQLRKHSIEKAEGGVYGWNSEKAFKDVVKALGAGKKKTAE